MTRKSDDDQPHAEKGKHAKPRPARESLPYRPCVGIMLLNREGRVFVGRRTDGAERVADGYEWQMPQGGIDEGEAPEPAALRELWEETGIRAVTVLAESPEWLAYDLPEDLVGVAWKGRYRGQKQKWFALRYEGDDAAIDVRRPPEGHKAEFSDWRWEAMDAVVDLVVPFKRPTYEAVVRQFSHLAP